MWTRALAVMLTAASLVFAQSTKQPPKSKAPSNAPTPAASPVRTLPPPKDESAKDKALVAFLAKLKAGLKAKDRATLLAVLSPDVDTGIRDMRGPNAFYTAWGLADADSSVYGVLTQILSLPGVWVGEQFCAPYIAVQFPSDLERSKHQVVLNPNVKVRQTEVVTSKTVATVSYEIVEVLQRTADWMKIRTQMGIEGYIQSAYVYSPAGYDLCLGKSTEGVWQLQSVSIRR